MATLAANSAASPSLSLMAREMVNPCRWHQNPVRIASRLGRTRRSNRSAIAPDFCSQSTDENFGPVCVCRYVSRLLLGHCFGAIPAPGGTAPLCFGYAALRVMVPP